MPPSGCPSWHPHRWASPFPLQGLQLFDQVAVSLRTLAAERTFLEKVTVLHEESCRPSARPRARKLARLYCDVARMIQQGVGGRTLVSRDLFQRVVEHRQTSCKHGLKIIA